MRKRIRQLLIIAVIAGMCICTTPYKAFASQSTKDKIEQAEKEKNQTESELSETKDNLKDLNGRQADLQKQLNNLNDQLQQISDRLNELDTQITDKEEEIYETGVALEEARAKEKLQYESMKKRIQFLYEDSETLYLQILFNAESFSDFITLNNYIDSLAEYDRNKLDEYEANRVSIENLEAQLIQEKAELNQLKAEAETEKGKVMGIIAQTSSSIAQYEDLIDEAEAIALQYEAKLKEQEKNIDALKKQLAEEIRLSQLAANSTRRDISEITFAEGDRYLLANLIYCEAGGEPYAGQLAVGAVVINRVLSSVFPDSVTGVIYANRQFSPVGSGRLAYALSVNKATARCYQAADEAMSGVTNVGNCVFFRTPIDGLNGIQIGGHIFY